MQRALFCNVYSLGAADHGKERGLVVGGVCKVLFGSCHLDGAGGAPVALGWFPNSA